MNPYVMHGKTVVSFSGGRTSAYLLRQVLDNNDDPSDLLVLFANTGKEHPATLDFVQDCADCWECQSLGSSFESIRWALRSWTSAAPAAKRAI